MRVYGKEERGCAIWEQITAAKGRYKSTIGYAPEYLEVTTEEYKALAAYFTTKTFTKFQVNTDSEYAQILGMKLVIKD